MAIRFKFYEEPTQFRPAESAAGKAWWREGMEATLRQTHDTKSRWRQVVSGKAQAITRASKRMRISSGGE